MHTISTCPQCGQEMHPTDYHASLRAINAELLEALKKMLREHDILSSVPDGNSLPSDRWPTTAKMARAAIAKATS